MKNTIVEQAIIEGTAGEGKSFFKINGKIIFVPFVVPRDKADILITKSKKDWGEGRLLRLIESSPDRQESQCVHFGICGGCQWQILKYNQQFQHKLKEVLHLFKTVGKIEWQASDTDAVPCEQQFYYRNKLEFAFSNKTYFTEKPKDDFVPNDQSPTLGYHKPKIFDKVIPIQECHLMPLVHNSIRNKLYEFCIQKNWTFYDRKKHIGLLRNVVIKMNTHNEVMLNLIVTQDLQKEFLECVEFLTQQFKNIASFYYTVNTKLNDTIYDLKPTLLYGQEHFLERLGHCQFMISPKSFFQTNTRQAEKLYHQIKMYANLKPTDYVLDLFCGVGSIGIYLSQYARQVLGIELVEEAIADANKNAVLNGVTNVEFIQGDIEKMAKQKTLEKLNFKTDTLIIDPPRCGLSDTLIQTIINDINPKQIVYVSCNAATQSRDLVVFKNGGFELKKLSVVDMFPHTYHIETVALLVKA